MVDCMADLVSEFHVVSTLHRFGTHPFLTLGDGKDADIYLNKRGRPVVTVEVNGVFDKSDWPADKICIKDQPHHFHIFISFDDQIENMNHQPSVWVVPSTEVERFMETYSKKKKMVSRDSIQAGGTKFWQSWYRILKPMLNDG